MRRVTTIFICTGLILLAACSDPDKKQGSQAMPVCISDSTKESNCVFLTGNEKEEPVISWCETDHDRKHFYMAFFNEQTGTFSDRINIPIEQSANFHEEGMPKLAFKSDGTIIAVYETSSNSEKNRFAGFVKYIVSADKGKSWSQPVLLHADTSGEKSHSFAAITRLSDGEVGACWLDESFDKEVGGRPVKFVKTNKDNKFENELIIDSVACQCCRIAMSSGPGGKIAVAIRDIINDSIRDMSVSSSGDNGKTFTPAVPFSKDGWVINGCPHNGPSLALADNNLYAAWFTGGPESGVYYCELNDKKETINKQLVSDHGRFIQLCLLKDGTRVLAYNENVQEEGKSYNKILLNKIQNDKVYAEEIKMERSRAGYPVLRSFGPDNIVVAWTSDEKVFYQVNNAKDIMTPVTRQAASATGYVNRLSNIKLASATDPVCGMPLSLSPADTSLYKEKVFGFCSETCKNNFVQNPEAFSRKLKSHMK